MLTVDRPAGPVSLDTLDLPGAGPAIVLLHEGLGSITQWRDFPAALHRATGQRVFAYSRQGYGRSSPAEGPRDVDYLHREALEWLPEVVRLAGIERPVLVGHSDGASIALIYASAHPTAAVVAMAPHVIVEDVTLAGIRAAAEVWRTTDLPERLARHHNDADAVFAAWQTIWRDPRFAAWDIQDLLPAITCPVLAIQGRDDEYGTLDQLERIAARCGSRVDTLALAACGHAPWRERPDLVIPAIAAVLSDLSCTAT
jgi:pimeloyl-ACP methyl ester carboxylesterase